MFVRRGGWLTTLTEELQYLLRAQPPIYWTLAPSCDPWLETYWYLSRRRRRTGVTGRRLKPRPHWQQVSVGETFPSHFKITRPFNYQLWKILCLSVVNSSGPPFDPIA